MEKLDNLLTTMFELVDELEDFTESVKDMPSEESSKLYRTEEFMKFLLVASDIHTVTAPAHDLVVTIMGGSNE